MKINSTVLEKDDRHFKFTSHEIVAGKKVLQEESISQDHINLSGDVATQDAASVENEPRKRNQNIEYKPDSSIKNNMDQKKLLGQKIK